MLNQCNITNKKGNQGIICPNLDNKIGKSCFNLEIGKYLLTLSVVAVINTILLIRKQTRGSYVLIWTNKIGKSWTKKVIWLQFRKVFTYIISFRCNYVKLMQYY